MRALFLALLLGFLPVPGLAALALSEQESEQLRSEVATMYQALAEGDIEVVVARSHVSLLALVGGPEALRQMTKTTVDELLAAGVRILDVEVGRPTQVYPAGEEEVCFLPLVTVMSVQNGKVRGTAFMVAIRPLGGGPWSFLDGAGTRNRPGLLYELLPALDPAVPLPPLHFEVVN